MCNTENFRQILFPKNVRQNWQKLMNFPTTFLSIPQSLALNYPIFPNYGTLQYSLLPRPALDVEPSLFLNYSFFVPRGRQCIVSRVIYVHYSAVLYSTRQ